jgi:hypothetical protein
MAKAYKCDICDKLVEDAYSVSGIDFYPDELANMGVKRDEARRKEVKEICESCHKSIRETKNKLYRDSH